MDSPSSNDTLLQSPLLSTQQDSGSSSDDSQQPSTAAGQRLSQISTDEHTSNETNTELQNSQQQQTHNIAHSDSEHASDPHPHNSRPAADISSSSSVPYTTRNPRMQVPSIFPLTGDSQSMSPRRWLANYRTSLLQKGYVRRRRCQICSVLVVVLAVVAVALFILLQQFPEVSFIPDSNVADGVRRRVKPSGFDDEWFCNGSISLQIRNPNILPLYIERVTMAVLYFEVLEDRKAEIGRVQQNGTIASMVIRGKRNVMHEVPFDFGLDSDPDQEPVVAACWYAGLEWIELTFVGRIQVKLFSGSHSLLQWGPAVARVRCHRGKPTEVYWKNEKFPEDILPIPEIYEYRN